MRNEGPQVLEWIAYHLSIGFDHIMIATNDCDDGSDELIKAIGQVAPVTHFDNSDPSETMPQRRAYAQMMKTDAFAQADYLMILDAGEFLNIHMGNHQLDDLIKEMGDHDVFGVNWACFGPSGERAWRDAWVTERFTERLVPKWGLYIVGNCKALTRKPQRFEHFFNHSPGKKKDRGDIFLLRDYGEVEIIPSDGKAKDTMRMNFAYKSEYRLAQINHYVTKSMPEFRMRIARGRGHIRREINDRHTQEYFDQFTGQNEMIFDTSILPKLSTAKVKAEALLENQNVANCYKICKSRFLEHVANQSRPWDDRDYQI